MKKVLFLILFIAGVANSQNYYYYYQPAPVIASGEINLSTLTNPPARWTDTTMSLSPYQSGYVYLPKKIMKTGHDNFVDLIMATTDSFSIEFRWSTNPTINLQRYLGIAGAAFLYQPANAQYVEVDFQGLGTYYKVYLQSYDGSDTAAKTIKLTWHKTDSTLRSYRNDTLKHTSTSNQYASS